MLSAPSESAAPRAMEHRPEEDAPSNRSSLSWFDSAHDSLHFAANFLSCENTLSLFKWPTGANKTLGGGTKSSKGSVDLHGRRAAEITLTRRPHFLCGGDAIGFSVPSVDNMESTLCRQASNVCEAPTSGTWRGRYYDGLAWRQTDFTLFFQDLIGRERGAKHSSGCSSLDIMGSCGSLSTTGCVAIIGSYSPDSGRVTWSQPAPPGDGGGQAPMWEVWAQLYASIEGVEGVSEQGRRVDRMFASYQDTNGKRGNMELVLCEGPAPPFVVGNSFWSHTGLDLFVHHTQQPPVQNLAPPVRNVAPPVLPQRPASVDTSKPSAALRNPSSVVGPTPPNVGPTPPNTSSSVRTAPSLSSAPCLSPTARYNAAAPTSTIAPIRPIVPKAAAARHVPVTLPLGWGLPPGQCAVSITHGKSARAEATLEGGMVSPSVIEDPNNTLV
mmetsp:Transcript_18220/g.35565  ORF Transcript_18220/g.35565 Transcript_18220/m.35565 type:complete len:440 (-) Transcript_18220:412-1731(-)|eukprot:CAMPEP_0173387426 /NCGR_PEP_ID=MMETSP1356-20130122/9931_1 /TAXON_ID=77927 ORGANISM="Hemiselmis virescens, Strain PCC157" /NCGR_SAMPLE_ID=MMETSP1356 /ASSEMBLY_ACC=CAM_ASM_000847 /LENGTH=439 /DNA_ID=CAMNT_0014344041 /DNA_START=329 /DNA_END=1648 /DNA_ORIENTATION=+